MLETGYLILDACLDGNTLAGRDACPTGYWMLVERAILWQAETPALLDAGFGIEYVLLI